MSLVLGVFCLSLCFFLYVAALLGTRSAKPPRWANETLMSCIITPMIVGCLAMGIIGIVQVFFSDNHPTSFDLALAGAVLLVSAFLYFLLGLKQKLARSNNSQNAGEVISVNFTAGSQNDSDNPPHATTPGMRKAA